MTFLNTCTAKAAPGSNKPGLVLHTLIQYNGEPISLYVLMEKAHKDKTPVIYHSLRHA